MTIKSIKHTREKRAHIPSREEAGVEDAFARLSGHTSHPIEVRHKGQKIAVRVINQFGEECTKVLPT
jgi:hypothetical protein